jgi:hypothetical protein
MAGAAVIVAVTNALDDRDFPFVFGGDGARLRSAAGAAAAARQALAETATWVKEDLDLTLRIGMVPVAEIRAQGLDVRVARYAPSDNISIAMFSGGGMAWADSAMKRGEITVPQAPPGRIPTSPACPAAMRKSRHREASCCRWWWRRGQMRIRKRFAPRSRKSPVSWRKTPDASRPVPGPATAFHLAPGRRRSRGASVAPRRRIDPRPQGQGSGADVFYIFW